MEESRPHSCESDTSTHLQGSGDAPMSTMNLIATLGLLPEDMDALAQMPESEISVETLPALIMQLKAKRAQEEARQRDVSPKTEIKKEHADSRDDRGKVPRLSVPFKKPHSSDRLSESETEARMNNQTNNETHNGTNPAQENAETGGAMIQPLQAARVSDPPKKKSGQKKTRKGSNHEEARTTVDFVPTWAEMGTHETEAKAISVPQSHRALKAGKSKPHQDDWLPVTIEETETRIISFGGEDHSDEMEDMLDLDMEQVPFFYNPETREQGLPPRNWEDLHDIDRHVNEMKETLERELMNGAVNKEVNLDPDLEIIRAVVEAYPSKDRKMDPVVEMKQEEILEWANTPQSTEIVGPTVEMPIPGKAAIKITQSNEIKSERNLETSVLNPQDGWAIARKELHDGLEKERRLARTVERSSDREKAEESNDRLRFFKLGNSRYRGLLQSRPERLVNSFLTNPHQWVQIRMIKPGTIKPSDDHVQKLDWETLMEHIAESKLLSIYENREKYSMEGSRILGRNKQFCDVSIWEYGEQGRYMWAHVYWGPHKNDHVEIFEKVPGSYKEAFYLTDSYQGPWVVSSTRQWERSDCANWGCRLMTQGKYREPGFHDKEGNFIPVFWNAYTRTWTQ
ncbi:uncharacterized protein LOC134014017 isoform X2 [Osmerus eperlanus]|uniref:uncharacterized protein LOC134014017 isoform X2 n=1 Tax=Osmerus eperlanus TaxID=29151 RepID=UPI002E109AC3